MASKRSSGIDALLRHLPKAHRTLVSASTFLVACSVTLFAFAIPPAFDAQPGGLFRGALFGTTNGESPTGGAQPAGDAAADGADGGTFSFSPGNIAPIGASSLGGVIATATAAVNEEGQAVTQGPQGGASAPGNQVTPGDQGTREHSPKTLLSIQARAKANSRQQQASLPTTSTTPKTITPCSPTPSADRPYSGPTDLIYSAM